MDKILEEDCRTDAGSKIRVGYASWDDGTRKCMSAKYTWFDKRGHACRGGEVPVEALPQMLELAIKSGCLGLSAIST